MMISNEPKRRKEGAMRLTTLQRSMMECPLYTGSRSTRLSDVTMLPARVVGMPCISGWSSSKQCMCTYD